MHNFVLTYLSDRCDRLILEFVHRLQQNCPTLQLFVKYFCFLVVADPSPPMMFVSTSYNIIQYNLLNQESDLFIRWRQALAFDWDIRDDLLFLSDSRENAIYVFNGTTTEKVCTCHSY